MRKGFGLVSMIYVRLIFLCVMQFGANAFAGTPGEIPVGDQLPEASLNNLAGGTAKLSAFRGKPLLINVWASWCGPCREEMGSLDRLARRYGGRNSISSAFLPMMIVPLPPNLSLGQKSRS